MRWRRQDPIAWGCRRPGSIGSCRKLLPVRGHRHWRKFFSFEINAKRLGLMRSLSAAQSRSIRRASQSKRRGDRRGFKAIAERSGADARGPSVVLQCRHGGDRGGRLGDLAQQRPDALFIAGDSFFASRAVQLATAALRERIPASFTSRPMVEAGLLMNYGTDIADMFPQVGAASGYPERAPVVADLPVFSPSNSILASTQRRPAHWSHRVAGRFVDRRRGDRITSFAMRQFMVVE